MIAGKALVGVPVVGAAVHQGDERERAIFSAPADRHDQRPVEAEPVVGLVGQAFLASPPDPAQFRPGVAEPDEPAAGRSGIDVPGLVRRGRQDGDHVTRAVRGQPTDIAVPA